MKSLFLVLLLGSVLSSVTILEMPTSTEYSQNDMTDSLICQYSPPPPIEGASLTRIFDYSSGSPVEVAAIDDTEEPCKIRPDNQVVVSYGRYPTEVYFLHSNGGAWDQLQTVVPSESYDFPAASTFLSNGDLFYSSPDCCSDGYWGVYRQNATTGDYYPLLSNQVDYVSHSVSPSGNVIVLLFENQVVFLDAQNEYALLGETTIDLYVYSGPRTLLFYDENTILIGHSSWSLEFGDNEDEAYYGWGRLLLYTTYNYSALSLQKEIALEPEDLEDEEIAMYLFWNVGLRFGRSCNYMSSKELLLCRINGAIIFGFEWKSPLGLEPVIVSRELLNFVDNVDSNIPISGDYLFSADSPADKIINPTICYCNWRNGVCSSLETQCTECFSDFFGSDCAPCTCENGICDDGVSGAGNCSECEGNYWGSDCNQNCTCVFGSCDQQTGKCDSKGCFSGFFGDDCDQQCTCVNGMCDPETGECDSNGCFSGFFGDNCDQAVNTTVGNTTDGNTTVGNTTDGNTTVGNTDNDESTLVAATTENNDNLVDLDTTASSPDSITPVAVTAIVMAGIIIIVALILIFMKATQ